MKSVLSKFCGLGVILIMLLTVSCSSPYSEEFHLIEKLHLAVLPFKMNGKYITYELNSSTQDTQFIKDLKNVNDIQDLEQLGERGYILIDSIEQFDHIYKNEQLYFILVKSFVNKNGSLKYIYVNNFNENNF